MDPTVNVLRQSQITDIRNFSTKEEAVKTAADIICDIVKNKPEAVITFATGNTPIPIYAELQRRVNLGEADFTKITAFHLDEYWQIAPSDPNSFVYYLKEKVFIPLHIDPQKSFTINGNALDPNSEAARYNGLLKTYPQDLVILGIGPGGHIGFNEPGAEENSETRLVDLAESTILRDHLERHQDTPHQAITQGIANILSAKKILLNVYGEEKAQILKKALYSPISSECPASFLRLQSEKVTIISYL